MVIVRIAAAGGDLVGVRSQGRFGRLVTAGDNNILDASLIWVRFPNLQSESARVYFATSLSVGGVNI